MSIKFAILLAYRAIMISSITRTLPKIYFTIGSTVVSAVFEVAKVGFTLLATIPYTTASTLLQTAPFMNAGLRLARKGTLACRTNNAFLTERQCYDLLEPIYVRNMINRTASNPDHFTDKELSTRFEKGLERSNGVFHIPQNRLIRYQDALQYAQLFIDLRNPLELENGLKTLHRKLTDDGTYRKGLKAVNPHKSCASYAKEHLTPRELAIFARTTYAFYEPRKFNTLAPKELAVWKKLLHFGTDQCHIEQEMTAFLQEFTKRIAKGGDFVAHASYFHTELARISPFKDAVGRIARIMTNVILENAEEIPVTFHNEEEYLTALREGTFTSYLKKEIAWTRANIPSLDDPLERRIITEARFMYPGLQIVNQGSATCVMAGNVYPFEDCEEVLRSLPWQLEHPAILARTETKETIREKGILINLKDRTKIAQVHHRMDPQKYTNYKRALGYIQETILENPAILKEYTAKTLKTINYVHILLTQNIDTHPGKYRNTDAQSIERDMRLFARDLTARLRQKDIDYIDLAAWVHTEIIRIKPYDDANGRLARILMNTILRLGHHPIVIFDNTDDYLQAVHDFKTFPAYIKKRLKAN